MINKLLEVYRSRGIIGMYSSISRKIFPERIKHYPFLKKYLIGKNGLEIGGPSAIFKKRNLIPVYQIINNLDNCTFTSETIWEGRINESAPIEYEKNRFYHQQFIADSTNLEIIPNEKYDFILSSHVIEHIANPVKALNEWKRVLKDKGVLIIVIPHKDGTFDHKRKVTLMEHLIRDYNDAIEENDLTHLEEILSMHDLSMDQAAGSFEEFKKRSEENFKIRGLHHHVFDSMVACKLLDYAKFKIMTIETFLPFHIIISAQKTSQNDNNQIFHYLNGNFDSPFSSDQT